MSKLEVNWAQVTFSNFTKHHSSFLPYGVFLSHIFKKFKVNLSSETNVRSFEFFDHSILLRMKLLNFQTPPTSTPQDHSTSQAHPSKVSHPTRSSIQHFYNAYYNTLHKPSISPLAKKNFFPSNPHEDSWRNPRASSIPLHQDEHNAWRSTNSHDDVQESVFTTFWIQCMMLT